MQNRLNQNDVTNRVNVEDPARVRDAVMAVYAARYPGIDLAPITQAFADFQALFEGAYPGFLACDTLYHDMRHTLDMTLALARLVDGHDRSCAAPERLGPRRAVLGVLIALLHDSGYLRRNEEGSIEDGRVADPRDRKIGCLVGAADLLGQMSDRMYLEKCREFLYKEFVWGKIARERLPDGHEVVRYASPEDLIIKTPGFYEYVARTRMQKKLGSADRYAEAHFDGPSLYQSEIDRNMDFLRATIEIADFNRLRRTCYSMSSSTRRAA